MDLDFPDELDEQFLVDIELVNPLNGTYKPGIFVPGNEDLPELPCTQLPPQLKILNFHGGIFELFMSLEFGK